MRAVILAGGKGRRLAPYTNILPKPLVPLGDMPILEVLIRQLKQSNVDEVILAVGHLSHLLKAYFGDGERFGLPITYSLEDQPLGTVGPLALIARPAESFLVMNGDVLTTLDFGDLLAAHRRQSGLATIAMQRRCNKIDLGVIECNGGNRILRYIEKPTHEYTVSMGIYVFEPQVLDYVPVGRYMDFPELVQTLIAAGETVLAYPFDGYWQDLGRPDDYEQAAQDFDRMRPQLFREVAP